MRFTSEASSDGVCEQLFTLGEIPGVLWTPEGAVGTRPLIVMGHGGGEHRRASGILARARDDERVPRDQSLALFDGLASAEKTLHANPGKHGEIPVFELDSALRFFSRHLA